MLTALHRVISFEDLPKDVMTVKTSRMLDVYLSEKNKMEFIEIFNENEKSK